jgi:hypothetical protein
MPGPILGSDDTVPRGAGSRGRLTPTTGHEKVSKEISRIALNHGVSGPELSVPAPRFEP